MRVVLHAASSVRDAGFCNAMWESPESCCAKRASASRSGRGEGRLRHHAVDALADVDHLADAAVRHHRGERIRLVSVEALAGEKVDGLAERVEDGLLQILVEANLDPVRLRL